MIDTHAHLNFRQFHEDLEAVIDRCFDGGLEYVINVGTSGVTSQESVNLAERFNSIYATVGVHPQDTADWEAQRSTIKKLLNHPKVVAVGEIGLDYFRDTVPVEIQAEAFKEQLALALEARKPIIIHCRDAYPDVLAILEEHYMPYLQGRHPGIIHSFAAGPAIAQRFLKLGFCIGINNMVTYPNNMSLVEAVKLIPLERIVVETDAPFLPPAHLRGTRCEPLNVLDAARKVADIKGVALGVVDTATTAAAKLVFNI